jgi:hypothetical protein
VHVGLQTVARANAGDLLVRLVDDHALALADARGGDHTLPPRQHRLALVLLNTEVDRDRVDGLEPDEAAVVVDDRRAALAGAVERGDEEQAGRRVRRVSTVSVGGDRCGALTKVAYPRADFAAANANLGSARAATPLAAAARNSRRVP